jgi:hypothetical protein
MPRCLSFTSFESRMSMRAPRELTCADGRRWDEMGGEERRWEEMEGDERRWEEMRGDGRRWSGGGSPHL